MAIESETVPSEQAPYELWPTLCLNYLSVSAPCLACGPMSSLSLGSSMFY